MLACYLSFFLTRILKVPKSSQSSFTLDVSDECRRRWCVTVTVPVNLDCDCDCHYNDKFVNSSVQLVVNSAYKI